MIGSGIQHGILQFKVYVNPNHTVWSFYVNFIKIFLWQQTCRHQHSGEKIFRMLSQQVCLTLNPLESKSSENPHRSFEWTYLGVCMISNGRPLDEPAVVYAKWFQGEQRRNAAPVQWCGCGSFYLATLERLYRIPMPVHEYMLFVNKLLVWVFSETPKDREYDLFMLAILAPDRASGWIAANLIRLIAWFAAEKIGRPLGRWSLRSMNRIPKIWCEKHATSDSCSSLVVFSENDKKSRLITLVVR